MSYLKKKIFHLDLLTAFLTTALCIFCFFLGGKFYNETSLGVIVLVGIGMGVFAGFILAIRDKFSKEQKGYIKGESGEEFLKNKIEKNLPEVLLCSDIKLRNSNADFVLICDYGIYCVENKNIDGKITFNEDMCRLLKNKYPFDDNYLKQVKSASREIKNMINDNLGIDIYIQPILVFSAKGASLDLPKKVEDVYVQTPSELVCFVRENKQQELSREDQIKIYDFLKKGGK